MSNFKNLSRIKNLLIPIITIFIVGCNTEKQKSEIDISIVTDANNNKEIGYGLSYVLFESETGAKYIIEITNSKALTMAGDPIDELLFADISEYKGFQFGIISKLSEPKVSGTIVKKLAIIEDCIVNNKGEYNVKFNIYYLVNENNKAMIYKEKWVSEWSDKAQLVDMTMIYPSSTNKKEQAVIENSKSYTNNSIKKVLIYKWCECYDYCTSSFIDEQGNEYNFGDLSGISNYKFQCYPNNSNGGVDDPLKERKFIVEFSQIKDNTSEELPTYYKIISIKLQD